MWLLKSTATNNLVRCRLSGRVFCADAIIPAVKALTSTLADSCTMSKKLTINSLPVFDMADYLDSDAAVAEYLSQVLTDGDDGELASALGHIAKARGMTQIAKDAGIGRESL